MIFNAVFSDFPYYLISICSNIILILDKLNIAVITRDYPPKIGGISTHSEALVKHLRLLDVNVTVFAGYNDSNTLMVPFNHDLNRFDIVHLQSTPYGPFISKTPLLVTAHATLDMELPYYDWREIVLVPLALLFERITLNKATLITADSNLTQSNLISRYFINPDRITLLPSGVDAERFSPLSHSNSKIKILICSRLEPRKNILQSLKALSELDQNLFEVLIVGTGSQRQLLETYSNSYLSNVRFVGHVSDEDLPSYFSTSDIFLSTSLSEGFGLSLLQAMASGCAVVASNIPTHCDFIQNGFNGLIYSSYDELINHLNVLLNDKTLISNIGINARERSLDYSWDKIANMTLDLYRNILSFQ